MKPNILLVCKKSPCFRLVKMVLGQFHPRKITPNPNPNPNANANSNRNRGAIFLEGNCPDTVKNKRNEKQKRNEKKGKRNKTEDAKFYQMKTNFSE